MCAPGKKKKICLFCVWILYKLKGFNVFVFVSPHAKGIEEMIVANCVQTVHLEKIALKIVFVKTTRNVHPKREDVTALRVFNSI